MTPLFDVGRASFPGLNLGRQRICLGILRISQGQPLAESKERNNDLAIESALQVPSSTREPESIINIRSEERMVLKRWVMKNTVDPSSFLEVKANLTLSEVIKRASSLIKNQQIRSLKYCSGDCNTLTLASRRPLPRSPTELA